MIILVTELYNTYSNDAELKAHTSGFLYHLVLHSFTSFDAEVLNVFQNICFNVRYCLHFSSKKLYAFYIIKYNCRTRFFAHITYLNIIDLNVLNVAYV